MTGPDGIVGAVRALPADGRLLLAVSGGIDSMVLLDATAAVLPRDRILVATFDHATGPASAEATALVVDECRRRGLRVRCGGGTALRRSEAAWRDARWRFLRDAAGDEDARIVTAHTADDQAESVLMRAMRGAGARGLAALAARSEILRPLLGCTRRQVAAYARERRIRWSEDPSNRDLRYFRNRVRYDLLPALTRARPRLREELLAIGRDAAQWRLEMDRLAAECCPSRRTPDGGLVVAADALHGYDAGSLAVLWPAIAARVGLALDRRGTRRLAEFTTRGGPGAVMPLSGGWVVVRGADEVELRRGRPVIPDPSRLPLSGALRWGRWSFMVGGGGQEGDRWTATLPADRPLVVRGWHPADRIRVGEGRVRVKRLLAESGLDAARRVGWPVVVAGDAIVWIPGVSRAPAATARSGRPGVSIRCEPSDR